MHAFRFSQRRYFFLTAALLFTLLLAAPGCAASKPTAPYPLGEAGIYTVGYTQLSALDESRDGREISLTFWYPAVKSEEEGSGSRPEVKEALPDASGAPYPVILSSTKTARILAHHVVPYGFVWVSVDNIDYWMEYNAQMVNQPRDLLFALEQAASNPPELLDGIIDASRAGVTGYSFDGYNAWALSGARIDPDFYRSQCANPALVDPALAEGLEEWGYCALAEAGKWETFAVAAGDFSAAGSDGLWQPFSDPRIQAAMPMAGDGWLVFGERGLAAVQMPILTLVASEDELYGEEALIYNHLGSADKTFITFKGLDHMMILDEEAIPRIAHFCVAFFGYHLQGNQAYADSFSQDFVRQHEELGWGVVSP